MANLEKEVFVCIDCETTGLDPKEDRIIEVAAVRFSMNEVFGEYETLVDPECLIPDSSIAIHHITQSMVSDKPTIRQILPQLLDFIGDDIIVGHGVNFDIEVIANSADRHSAAHRLRNSRFLDTLRMARLYGESPVNSLEHLRQHFNIQFEGPHRAMSDVIVNKEVFKYLARRYRSTEQIFNALARPIYLKTMPLGKHKGRQMKEIPLQYLQWAANKDFDGDLLYTIRSELARRKKGNLFSQSTNPFAEL